MSQFWSSIINKRQRHTKAEMASIEGSLFNYGSDGLVAFESPAAPDTESQGYIIFLGGLGDGMFSERPSRLSQMFT